MKSYQAPLHASLTSHVLTVSRRGLPFASQLRCLLCLKKSMVNLIEWPKEDVSSKSKRKSQLTGSCCLFLTVLSVGDCYVAVVGIPDPRKDHAKLMARFANDILSSFKSIVRNLEVKLGPDTGDLDLRIGMHSGPVTAGVVGTCITVS